MHSISSEWLLWDSERDHLEASGIRLNHLLGVFSGGIGQAGAAQHPGNFLSALRTCDLADRSPGSRPGFALLDQVVMVGKGRDLGQMGNTKNLISAGELLQLLAHGFGRAAADP